MAFIIEGTQKNVAINKINFNRTKAFSIYGRSFKFASINTIKADLVEFENWNFISSEFYVTATKALTSLIYCSSTS